MGSKDEGPHRGMSSIALALGMAASLLTITLIGFGLVAEGDYTKNPFRTRGPIFIDGNADLNEENGVVGGSGTASNPFVIEGWSIVANRSACIVVNNTDANIIIRNVSMSATWNPTVHGLTTTGIWLDNATNIRIESCLFSTLAQGVRANRSWNDTAGSFRISTCFFSLVGKVLTAENMTDCSITRSYCTLPGYDWVIAFENCTSVTISNNTVVQAGTWSAVAKVGNSSVCLIRDNHISVWGHGYGIWAYNSSEVVISDNHVDCYADYGISVQKCTQVEISANEISSGDGVLLDRSSNSYVQGNLVHMVRWESKIPQIVMSDSIDSIVRENILSRAGAIVVNGCIGCVVNDNLVSESGYYNGWYASNGMWSQRCSELMIRNNVIVNCTGQGLYVSGIDVTVEGNVITGNSNSLMNTMPSGSGLGASGSNLIIRYNLISNNTRHPYYRTPAVYLNNCDYSTFECNNISDDFEVYFCENITVRSNRFAAGWNMTVFSLADRATFSLNDFIQPLAFDIAGNASATIWNASYPEGGNYWSSYSGVDEHSGLEQNLPGSDGIGDTPYKTPEGVNDSYPLMMPTSYPDLTRPVTFAILNGTLGDRTWYVSNVSIVLPAYDSNGSRPYTWFSLDGRQLSLYNGTPIDVTGDGLHTLLYSSVDAAAHTELTKQMDIRIDTQPPRFGTELLSEFKYRLRNSESVYVSIDPTDELSGMAYTYGVYNITYFDVYNYPQTVYSVGNWLQLVPPDGTTELKITLVDGAGNSNSAAMTLAATIAPNTSPLSPYGPYSGWYLLGLLLDLGLVIAALEVLAISRTGWVRRNKWEKRDEGERHYDEDVIDGYPKYMKKM